MKDRLSTFARLASAFPMSRGQDMELTLDTYIKLTMDVPPRWLATAVVKLCRMSGTGFIPTIGRVLQVVATEARAVHRRANGQDPTNGDRGPLKDVPEDRVDEYIGRVRAWEGLPALPDPSSAIIALPMEVEKRVRDLISRSKDTRPVVELERSEPRRADTHGEPF